MPEATLMILNGRVFDGRTRTEDTAVALRDERVIAIGDDESVRAHRGAATRVIDARGGAILPGFVDAHIHAAFAGVERLSLDLTPATTVEETLSLVRAAADRTTDEWLTGGGWSHELFPAPTRQQLDAVVPDRPVALSDAGHHTLWVNSRALEIAGVTRDTKDPPNGHIHRDETGEPTGYLNETAAELVGRFIPPATEDMIEAGLLHAQEFLWSLGVTGWHEAILGEYNGKGDCTDAYRATVQRGELTSRVSGALWIPPGTRADEAPAIVERFVRLREQNAQAGFPTPFVKMMVDGVPHGETAALLEPYCSHAGSGALHIDPDSLTGLVVALDAAGFGLHLHVMGDRGVRVALDAVEAARRSNGDGPEHQIAHLSMVRPEDARRFGPLGVAANMQALWAAPDPFVVPMIGDARMRAGYPFRSLADSGAALAMGSDWPVSPADPWVAIHVAVNRSLPVDPTTGEAVEDPDVLDACQALTLAEALGAYTRGSSQLVLGGGGRVRVGARADLVVSTVDPFEVPTPELHRVETAHTIVNGRHVFQAQAAKGN